MSNFPYSLTRNITSHSMKNLVFHSTQMKDDYRSNSFYITHIHFALKGWENVLFERERGRVKVEITLQFESKFRFPGAQFRFWQMLRTHLSVNIKAKCRVSWPSLERHGWRQAVKTDLEFVVLCNNLWLINPFTPKGDQLQISPAPSPEILHHSMENVAFHSLLR